MTSPVDRRGLQEVVTLSIATVATAIMLTFSIVDTGLTNPLILATYGIIVNTLIARSTQSAADRAGRVDDRRDLLGAVGSSVATIATAAITVASYKKTGIVDPLIITLYGTIISVIVARSTKNATDRIEIAKRIEESGLITLPKEDRK